jgi:hypothetical protein
MSLFALITWVTAAGAGLYLLSIWLIEYDKEFQAAAATRLPPPVVAAHVLLAAGGMVAWIGYLLMDKARLAWIAAAAIAVAATLGMVMAIRWIGVYRASRPSQRLATGYVPAQVHSYARGSQLPERAEQPQRPAPEGPPERNFPVSVVVAHGAFAVLTVTLVLLTLLGVGR